MQTKHLCVLIDIWTKVEVGAPWNWFKPSSKIVLLTFPRRCFFCGSFMLFLSCFCYAFVRLFINTLWSPAGKGLTSCLSFMMSNYEFVTFPLVSWVRCGAWLYWFLIFALFLSFTRNQLIFYQVYFSSPLLLTKYTMYLSSKIYALLYDLSYGPERQTEVENKPLLGFCNIREITGMKLIYYYFNMLAILYLNNQGYILFW